MAGDPLYDSLGTQPPRRRRGRRIVLTAICLAALVAALAGLRLIWPVKPMRDESVAVAAIEPAPKTAPAQKTAPAAGSPAVQNPPARAEEGRGEPRGDPNIVVQPNGDTIEYQHGVKIIRLGAARQTQMSAAPDGGTAGPSAGAAITFKPAISAVRVDAPPPGGLSSAETARTGPTATPARPSPLATNRTIEAPRLALMVGGLGLDRSATADASTRLPPEVSFAFSPDGVDLTAQIMAARANGHEAILQLPMDGGKAASPSHVLTANAGEPALLDRLHWLLARATGYTGTVNEGGDVFLADAAASSPVFKDLAAKGLFFVGSGTVPVGRVDAAAQAAVLPHGAVDVVIDLSGEAATRASLTRLKDVGGLNGQAVGYVPVLPSNPDQIARLAMMLAAQAIRLVPVGALIAGTPVADQAKRD